jgi:hypothetical protein
MIDESAVAELELERHRPQMLYAERQLVKAGAFEAAAESLVRRSHLRLTGMIVTALVFAVSAYFDGSVGFLIWGGAMLLYAALDHSHTKRTLETIRRITRAAEQEPPTR